MNIFEPNYADDLLELYYDGLNVSKQNVEKRFQRLDNCDEKVQGRRAQPR